MSFAPTPLSVQTVKCTLVCSRTIQGNTRTDATLSCSFIVRIVSLVSHGQHTTILLVAGFVLATMIWTTTRPKQTSQLASKVGIEMRRETLTRRILAEYRQADTISIAGGLTWYTVAQEIAENLAAGTPYTIDQTASVLACLSPRTTWEANVAAARAALQAHATGASPLSVSYEGFRVNMVRAFRILDGHKWQGGPKTGPFRDAILGDSDAVVVDVWAYRAACRQDPPRNGIKKSERTIIVEAYRQAARIAGIEPRTMQAVVWCSKRGKVS